MLLIVLLYFLWAQHVSGTTVNRTWENIKENSKTTAKESLGLHELKQHKPWFDEEYLGLLDQRKRAKCSGYRIQAKAM